MEVIRVTREWRSGEAVAAIIDDMERAAWQQWRDWVPSILDVPASDYRHAASPMTSTHVRRSRSRRSMSVPVGAA
jgi:hypothetical protein